MRTDEKLEAFAARLEADQLAKFINDHPRVRLQTAQEYCAVTIKGGRRWVKVDVGMSGKFMVDEDGSIYGIKGYGVPHKGKRYGNLDTIEEWDWSGYHPEKRQS